MPGYCRLRLRRAMLAVSGRRMQVAPPREGQSRGVSRFLASSCPPPDGIDLALITLRTTQPSLQDAGVRDLFHACVYPCRFCGSCLLPGVIRRVYACFPPHPIYVLFAGAVCLCNSRPLFQACFAVQMGVPAVGSVGVRL